MTLRPLHERPIHHQYLYWRSRGRPAWEALYLALPWLHIFALTTMAFIAMLAWRWLSKGGGL